MKHTAQGALCIILKIFGEPEAWEELILASPEREIPKLGRLKMAGCENTMQQNIVSPGTLHCNITSRVSLIYCNEIMDQSQFCYRTREQKAHCKPLPFSFLSFPFLPSLSLPSPPLPSLPLPLPPPPLPLRPQPKATQNQKCPTLKKGLFNLAMVSQLQLLYYSSTIVHFE